MLDFQVQQDSAKGRTRLLVFLYVLAVLAVGALSAPIFLGIGAFIVSFAQTDRRSATIASVADGLSHPADFLTTPKGIAITAAAVGVTILVMVVSSLYRWAELRGGGSGLAEGLGASFIPPESRDPAERRLLNVVEEMAIAASTPVPPVYVLRNEAGVNAFAAGYAPSDAAIVVTRGLLESMNRDQLQGVVAHEFSHILNGDMRLNIRLLALLHGIVAISIIGRVMMEMDAHSRSSRRGGLFIPGLLLWIVGSIGAGAAALVRAAVSRQREYLADASAVQFTRNPAGIAGALKVIGGAARRGRITSARVQQCNHMCIADARSYAVLASHPPLEDRIRRLDPAWDGSWPRVAPFPTSEPAKPRTDARDALGRLVSAVSAGGLAAAVADTAPGWTVGDVLERVAAARSTLGAIPEDLLRTARDAFDAQALLLAMLLSRRPEIAGEQLRTAAATLGQPAAIRASTLQRLLLAGAKERRLPLLLLSLGTLASLSRPQYEALRTALDAVLAVNPRMDLFKLCVRRTAAAHLDRRFAARHAAAQYYALTRLAPECSTLLSAIAVAGQAPDADLLVRRAGEPLRVPGLRAVPAAELSADRISGALDALAGASAPLRRRIVEACAAAAGADEVLMHAESELISAIADALDVPLAASPRA